MKKRRVMGCLWELEFAFYEGFVMFTFWIGLISGKILVSNTDFFLIVHLLLAATAFWFLICDLNFVSCYWLKLRDLQWFYITCPQLQAIYLQPNTNLMQTSWDMSNCTWQLRYFYLVLDFTQRYLPIILSLEILLKNLKAIFIM